MRRLTASEIDDLANLFLTGNFAHPIELSVEEIAFAAAGMGEPYPEFDGQMEYRTIMAPDGDDTVKVRRRSGWLELGVGQWLDQPDNKQVVLSSNRKELDTRFGQINLNLCLTDGKTVYLVKNLSKDGGSGAIKRLFGGAGGPEMRSEREMRRRQLEASLGNETVLFEEDEWLVVATAPLRVSRRRADGLFTEAMVQILRYAAQVERLRHGADTGGESDTGGGAVGAVHRRLTVAERKLIELEAMAVVRAHLESQGHRVRDVASRESYDFEADRGGQRRYVEVKGTTVRPWSVELTGAEHKVASREGDGYSMYVVVFEDLNRLEHFELVEVGNPVSNAGCMIAPVRYRVCER